MAQSDATTAGKLRAIARACVEGLRSLAFAAGGTCEEVRGTTCWYSSSHVHLFNGAAILDAAQITPDTIDTLNLYFVRKQRPYCFLTLQELLPSASAQLSNLGYIGAETLPAMWLPEVPERWPTGPDDLHIARVADVADLEAYRSVLSRVFYMPRSEVDLVLGEKTLEATHVYHYLGKLGELPVATATVVLDGALAGIWNVGTLPDYERRGIGTEMMRHALVDARQVGYPESMLLASPDGIPLYHRLGYTTLATVKTFIPTRYHG